MQVEIITDPTAIKNTDHVVILLGLAGAGKSNMIDMLLESPEGRRRASDGLTSLPPKIEAVRIDNEAYPHPIVVVDTPGFDHPEIPDFEKARIMIENWLQKAKNINSSSLGVLYFHRITDRPVDEKAFQVLDKFLKMRSVKNVVFVTTMWNSAANDPDEINAEKELETKYWRKHIKKNALVKRFNPNNSTAAWDIIDSVITNSNKANEDRSGGNNFIGWLTSNVGRCGTSASTEA